MFTGALKTIRDGLLGLTYPSECRVCGASVESWDDGVACAACWLDPALTPLFREIQCKKCGFPRSLLPGDAQVPTSDCPACRDFPFNSARSCGLYAGALEASIRMLKTQPHLCPRLSTIVLETYERHKEALGSDLVMPVPLHSRRLR